MNASSSSRRILWNRMLVAFAFVFACLAAGPTTNPVAPATQQSTGRFEREVVRAPGTPRQTVSTTQPSVALTTFDFDTGRLVLALGSVLLLIFVMRLVLRKFFPHVSTPKSNNAMRILSRLPINPKQQLLLVQVGRRVVVVGDSGTNLSRISEISDPDEVTQLTAQLLEDHRSIETRSFVNLFGKARQDFDEQEVSFGEKSSLVSDDSSEEIEATKNELNGLISKVRDLSSQFRKP